MGLVYSVFGIIVVYYIYKIAKFFWNKADIEDRMDKISDTKTNYDKIQKFIKKNGWHDYNNNIKKFTKGE